MSNKYKIWAVSLATMVATGCTGSFEEINTDPDAYSKVPYTNMLANVLRRTADQYGGDLDIAQWAGYVSEVQYLNNYGGYIPFQQYLWEPLVSDLLGTYAIAGYS